MKFYSLRCSLCVTIDKNRISLFEKKLFCSGFFVMAPRVRTRIWCLWSYRGILLFNLLTGILLSFKCANHGILNFIRLCMIFTTAKAEIYYWQSHTSVLSKNQAFSRTCSLIAAKKLNMIIKMDNESWFFVRIVFNIAWVQKHHKKACWFCEKVTRKIHGKLNLKG